MGRPSGSTSRLEPQPRDIYDETKLEAEQLVASAGGSMTCTSLRMSRCFPEPAELMAAYRLHRGIDRRDVAEAHALALDREGRPQSMSSAPPRRSSATIARSCCDDAPAVIERRCPGLIDRMAAKGWQPPHSIDRVYDSSLAARELGFRPRFGIDACLAGDWDPLPSQLTPRLAALQQEPYLPSHDLDQRHPPRLSRLFREGRACARAVGAAGAAQRPDADVRQRRDGAVQERLHRARNAALRRPRLSSQKCVRAGGKHNDLDNVGYTARHHTFFEMLGNFSFGDYFKDQAIHHAWTLLTKEWGLRRRPADRHRLSHRRRGVRPVEEDRRPARKPHHPHPDQGQFLGDGRRRPVRALLGNLLRPWRPYPRRPARAAPDEDGDRFVEIWNLVFMQYEQAKDEIVSDLPKTSIDTGMGLERVAAVMQGVHDNYDTDTFKALIAASRGADPDQGGRRAAGQPPRHRRPSARVGLPRRRRRAAGQ